MAGALCLFSLAGSTQAGRDDEACPCAAVAAAKCFPAWNQVATPAGSNSFYAVAAFARNDVWAVGSRYNGINDRPLAEHFDGSRWTVVPVPASDNGAAYLRGVNGSSGTDVWAAGYQITQSGAQQSLIEHYEGVAWSIIPSANPTSWRFIFLRLSRRHRTMCGRPVIISITRAFIARWRSVGTEIRGRS